MTLCLKVLSLPLLWLNEGGGDGGGRCGGGGGGGGGRGCCQHCLTLKELFTSPSPPSLPSGFMDRKSSLEGLFRHAVRGREREEVAA